YYTKSLFFIYIIKNKFFLFICIRLLFDNIISFTSLDPCYHHGASSYQGPSSFLCPCQSLYPYQGPSSFLCPCQSLYPCYHHVPSSSIPLVTVVQKSVFFHLLGLLLFYGYYYLHQ